MESSRKINYLFLLAFLFVGCFQKDTYSDFQEELGQLKKDYAPDSRSAVFEFEIAKGVLRGEVDNPILKAKVDSVLKAQGLNLIDSLRLLPDLEDTLAYANVSVASLRTKPSESSELATQALLGTPLRVLEKKGSWYRVQTPDSYIGFLEGSAMSFNNDFDWHTGKAIYIAPYGFAFEKASNQARNVSDLTFGNILKLISQENGYSKIMFPDGRLAYVESKSLKPVNEFVNETDPTKAVVSSQGLMGIPYLWGGTSWKGVDCSGFTRTSFLMNGVYLPRDASQQALVGDEVNTSDGFEELNQGDLLFFGRETELGPKVVHVAIYLGGLKFIHSSGMVRYGSFDKASPDFDAYNLDRFLFAKRIIGSDNIRYLDQENFY
ncbi:MAG: cell wall-associated NlpC family hydrolase [Arcticibacterium sp.]|jgi:cell wall-associated NlpC family hydrolase